MSVWVCLPSARPVAEANAFCAAWHARGYKVAMVRDTPEPVDADYTLGSFQMWGRYPGYSVSLNQLAKDVLAMDPQCNWIVATGDDTLPDQTKTADEIARECEGHFGTTSFTREELATFGVMQPTGDPWRDVMGKIIDRIAGSPWLGREWCLRANQGNGPLWPKFYHCFADETLQNVATKLGVFWQRPDLTHTHNNWARARGMREDMPDFLKIANSPEHWAESKAEFERLKADDFRECMPL